MAYINSELIELLIIGVFPAALLYFFKEILPRESGMRMMTYGLLFVTIGVAINYLIHTPLRSEFSALFGEENLNFIRPLFYIPGGIITFIGVTKWFRRIIDFQAEIRLRKNAERLASEKNELIEQVLESSTQGILLIDKNLVIQLTNRRFLDLLDLPEKFGRPGTPYKDPIKYLTKRGEYGDGQFEQVYSDWVNLMQKSEFLHFQRSRPNGTILDIESRWIPGMGQLCTFTDVTKQSYAELELTKSKEKFRDFSESASDWMWEIDEKLALTYISELGIKLSGYDYEELLQKPPLKTLSAVEDANWEKALVNFSERGPFKDFHCAYQHPDDTKLFISVSGKPFFDSSNVFKGYRGVGRDITARKLVEEQLQQSQKMEAIGRLTGGIAHDFNNLLAIILGNAELLKEKSEENQDDALPVLKIIEKTALRGAELTQQLLSFSRKQRLQPSSIDLIEGMSDIIALIGRSLGEDIHIEVNHTEGLWNVLTDLGQLENAILNLANNARDAMPNGGTLTITTENHHQKRLGLKNHNGLPAGEYVSLTVADTGCGMTKKTIENMFEPFFTTKDVGKGTGLGLSMVFGFAKQSNGHVSVKSQPGSGTTVKLLLPRALDRLKKTA
ncbi:MAG: PAS-domain containing protein [Sneathiella sp.]|nr:PAS-domain containing protein [Sneathiella sp.]